MSGGVYQIICLVNGKRYIGSTVNFSKRKSSHFKMLERGIHHSPHLQYAYNKYGANNFRFEILEVVPKTELLLQREQTYIDLYKTYEREYGYNTLPVAGSSLGFKQREEVIRKISRSLRKRYREHKHHLKGRKLSEETRIKMSNARKGSCNPNWGKETSVETKKKISNSIKKAISEGRVRCDNFTGRKHSSKTKQLIKQKLSGSNNPLYGKCKGDHPAAKAVINITTGQIFNSIKEAAITYGLAATSISAVCKGKRQSCGGFKWKYL